MTAAGMATPGTGGILAIAFACLAIALPGCEPAALDSPVVVIVNGKPITQSEFDYRWSDLPESTRARYRSEGGKRKFLDDLISRELLLQEARRFGLDRSPSIRERTERFKEQLVLDELINEAIKGTAQVTDAELDAYTASHAAGTPPIEPARRDRLRQELYAEKHRKRYEEFVSKLRGAATIRMADASRLVLQDGGGLPPASTP